MCVWPEWNEIQFSKLHTQIPYSVTHEYAVTWALSIWHIQTHTRSSTRKCEAGIVYSISRIFHFHSDLGFSSCQMLTVLLLLMLLLQTTKPPPTTASTTTMITTHDTWWTACMHLTRTSTYKPAPAILSNACETTNIACDSFNWFWTLFAAAAAAVVLPWTL